MHYDTTLKQLFHHAPQQLLRLLTGSEAVEVLSLEIPSVQLRRPDLIARLRDGRLLHLELEGRNTEIMLWRMLEYTVFIRRHFRQMPVQQVLYTGAAALRMPDTLNLPSLWYRCPMTDLRTIDGQSLLASVQLEDRLLALLCRLDDPRQALRDILADIIRLPDKARADRLRQLLILAGMRRLEDVLKEELQTMPITVDLSENKFFQEAFAKGRAKGEAEGRAKGEAEGRTKGEAAILRRILRRRFGALPQTLEEAITAADSDTLLDWSEAAFSADALADFLRAIGLDDTDTRET